MYSKIYVHVYANDPSSWLTRFKTSKQTHTTEKVTYAVVKTGL